MNANIMKKQIFHQMKYDLRAIEGHTRSPSYVYGMVL